MDVSDINVRCATMRDVFYMKKLRKLCVLRFMMPTPGKKIKEEEI
jgi:hypothetical protein